MMPYNEDKDISDVSANLEIKAGKEGHYFEVFLWDNFNIMQEQVCDCSGNCMAVVNHTPITIDIDSEGKETIDVPYKLGEVHFAKGKWNQEVVAHELLHCLWQRFKWISPDIHDVLEQNEDHEETICYEWGKWFSDVYIFLWENDPCDKWRRKY